MLPDAYIKKNGYIYGHRTRYNRDGSWYHEYIRFTNADKAVEWKRTADFGFRRELLSKTKMKALGVKFDKKGRIVA